MRVIGLTIVVIGWLYLFGGRSGSRQSLLLPSSTDWSSSPQYWCLSPLLVYFLTSF
jgi:hypothetical protein